MTLSRRLAAPAALVAIVGTVGWVGGPSLARGAGGVWLFAVVAIIALGVGAATYVWVERFSKRALEPIDLLAKAVRGAAVRPRDHIAVFRRFSVVADGADPILRDLVEATALLLRRIEERQAQQTAWLGGLVHDVKTPIVGAANALGALANQAGSDGVNDKDLVTRIAVELRNLAVHVQVMLDAIRLEREDVAIDVGPLDLGCVVRTIVGRVSAPVGVVIEAEGQATVLADRVLMERAIENLVANAVRCARSRVSVQVFPGLVRIEDDGPGLPAQLEVLSAPFRSESVSIGGFEAPGGAAGMGLFLARRVLELHQGKLVAERSDSTGTVLLAYVGAPPVTRHAR